MEAIGIDGWSSSVRFVRSHKYAAWDGAVVRRIARVWALNVKYGGAGAAV